MLWSVSGYWMLRPTPNWLVDWTDRPLCQGLPPSWQETQIWNQSPQEEPKPKVWPDLRVQGIALRVSWLYMNKKGASKTTLVCRQVSSNKRWGDKDSLGVSFTSCYGIPYHKWLEASVGLAELLKGGSLFGDEVSFEHSLRPLFCISWLKLSFFWCCCCFT